MEVWAFGCHQRLDRETSSVSVVLILNSVLCLTQLNFQRKVGVMYCRAGQSSEEDMYNNESSGPAFEEFLDLLGERVRLKGWDKYRAQLDNKSELTTHTAPTRQCAI